MIWCKMCGDLIDEVEAEEAADREGVPLDRPLSSMFWVCESCSVAGRVEVEFD